MKHEYWNNKKSEKWKKLKKKFSKMKKTQSQQIFSDLIESANNKGISKWFKICKRVGFGNSNTGKVKVECLDGIPETEAAGRFAAHFASMTGLSSLVL